MRWGEGLRCDVDHDNLVLIFLGRTFSSMVLFI